MYRADVSQMQIHPNHLNPPFDNVKARQALMLMANQKDYLRAIAGDPQNFRVCCTYLGCGGWLETDAGADLLKKQDLEKAKQLLAEAGYKGEKIVVMAPSDFATINAASLTTAAMLRKIGVNVDLQVMDWGTLDLAAAREGPAVQEPGGLAHLPHRLRTTPALKDPWGHANISTACDKAWFGWPCSPRATKALEDLGNRAPGTDAFKKGLTEYHSALMENIPYVPAGRVLPDGGVSEGPPGRYSRDAPYGVLEHGQEVDASRPDRAAESRAARSGSTQAPEHRPCSPTSSAAFWRPSPSWASWSSSSSCWSASRRAILRPSSPGDYATPEDIQKIRVGLGLDQPIHVQFAHLRRQPCSGATSGASLHSRLPVRSSSRSGSSPPWPWP